MNSENPILRHILVVDDQFGRRVFGLDAATFSAGRDPTNAIVLNGEGISRQHAILLRLPSTDGYVFRVIDGNSAGKRSTNGITVNGERCFSQDLKTKDLIVFGGVVKAQYYTIPMTDDEYAKYTESPEFRSIKSSVVDNRQTSAY